MDPLIWAPLVALAVLAGVALSLCWAYYVCSRGECLHTIVTQVIFNAQLSQSAGMMLKEMIPTGLTQSSKPGGICHQLGQFLGLLCLHIQFIRGLLFLQLQLLRVNPGLPQSSLSFTRGFLRKR